MRFILIVILASILFLSCSKSTSESSTKKKLTQDENPNNKPDKALLISANNIKKTSDFTEKEIEIISEAFRTFFIAMASEQEKPILITNVWECKISIGQGFGGSSVLKVNNITGIISFKKRELGLWSELNQFVNANGFGKNAKNLQEVSILDSFKTKSNLKLISEAEQNLTSDSWENNVRIGRYNLDRHKREADLASKLLEEIKPKLQDMQAVELLKSLKPTANFDNSGVAYRLYLHGNELILKLIRDRPKKELEKLRPYYLANMSIWTGDSGPDLRVKYFVDEILHQKQN